MRAKKAKALRRMAVAGWSAVNRPAGLVRTKEGAIRHSGPIGAYRKLKKANR